MQSNPDLQELMARVALRERAAFEHLYRMTSAHLFTVSLRTLRNEQRAQENLQEAYVSIWNHAASYRPGAGTPMTWMINIVRNRAIDTLRSRRTDDEKSVELDDEALAVSADAAGEPMQLLEQSLLDAHIGTCMQTLSGQQRQALALAYYRGMVHTEIAEANRFTLSGATLSAWQLDSLRSGDLYLNAHSAAHPSGEIRGQLGVRVFSATAGGANEVPATSSAATGRALFSLHPDTGELKGQYAVNGMAATLAHIHMGDAGVNGPVLLGLIETAPQSGIFGPPKGSVLSAAQASTLIGGGLYVNAHSANFPAGEVRGQLSLDK